MYVSTYHIYIFFELFSAIAHERSDVVYFLQYRKYAQENERNKYWQNYHAECCHYEEDIHFDKAVHVRVL